MQYGNAIILQIGNPWHMMSFSSLRRVFFRVLKFDELDRSKSGLETRLDGQSIRGYRIFAGGAYKSTKERRL